jgi:hypothetical protein
MNDRLDNISPDPGRWGWTTGGYWNCEICRQQVAGVGPWCASSCEAAGRLCRPRTKEALRRADAIGDGPLVNALCWYGRQQWGQDLDW